MPLTFRNRRLTRRRSRPLTHRRCRRLTRRIGRGPRINYLAQAFERHQHLRPHRLLPLGAVARMVDIAARFGRLACGLGWPGLRPAKPPEEFSPEALPLEMALERGYRTMP